MATYNFVTDFPKLNDFRFHKETPDTSVLYNTFSFDEASLQDSLLCWQQQNTYAQKKIFPELCTVMVHTQAWTGAALPYPDLDVLNSRMETIANLSVTPFTAGAQQVSGNVDYDAETNTTTQLNSYLWQFQFSQFLSSITDSGIYYLRLSNNSADGAAVEKYLTEPIIVYGNDATAFPSCMLFQSRNDTNRASQATLASGWDNDFIPTFQHRVEAHRRAYSPKGIYISMLEQEYQPLKLNAQNYRSFTLDIGGQSQGIPDYLYEKLSEAVITDFFTGDGIPYMQDVTDTDAGIKQLWKGKQPEPSQLGWYTLAIRERYNSQYVFRQSVVSPCSCPFVSNAYQTYDGKNYNGYIVFDMSAGFTCAFKINISISGSLRAVFTISSLSDLDFVSGTLYQKGFLIGGPATVGYEIVMVASGVDCGGGSIAYGCSGPTITAVTLVNTGGSNYAINIQYALMGVTCHIESVGYSQLSPATSDTGTYTDTLTVDGQSTLHVISPGGALTPGTTISYSVQTTDCCGLVRNFTVSYRIPCSAAVLQKIGGAAHDMYIGIAPSGGAFAFYCFVLGLGSDCNSWSLAYTQTNALSAGSPDSGTLTGTFSATGANTMGTTHPNPAHTGVTTYHVVYTDCCGNVITEDIYI